MENKLTDVAPIYVRNGYMLPMQNTDKVTKTSQLNNKFDLVGGCEIKSETASAIVCQAKSGIMSLGDY